MERPDLDRLGTSLKAVVLQVRAVWHLVKAAGEKLAKGIEAIGEGLIIGLIALQMIVDLLRKPLGWAGLATAVGMTSPLTGGYGNSWLSASPEREWIPLLALPLVILALWLLSQAIVLLNREGEREAKRRQREQPHPGLKNELAQHRRRRKELNEPLRFNRKLPLLEEASFCVDIMTDTSRSLRSRSGNRDVVLVLGRWTEGLGYSVVEAKGPPLDREVRIRLELGEVEEEDVDRLLGERLEDLQYWHETVPFETGERRYLLIAVSGATIGDDVKAEISESAVLMLEEYVWALRSLGLESGEA